MILPEDVAVEAFHLEEATNAAEVRERLVSALL